MNVDAFLAWMQTEPDSYELIDGEPVHKPDEEKGGPRFGHFVRAAELAMGRQRLWEWLSTKSPKLGGTEPFRYVYESWGPSLRGTALAARPGGWPAADGRHVSRHLRPRRAIGGGWAPARNGCGSADRQLTQDGGAARVAVASGRGTITE